MLVFAIMKEQMQRKRYEDFKKDLELLKTKKREEIAERLHTTRSFGDLSENSEYDAARNAQAELESKINIMEEQLRNVEIVDAINKNSVQVGTKVVLINPNSKKDCIYNIVNTGDSDISNRLISVDSPIGSALLGHKVGDGVEIELPESKVLFKIKSIE